MVNFHLVYSFWFQMHITDRFHLLPFLLQHHEYSKKIDTNTAKNSINLKQNLEN